jgi:hemolysin activation/secretion protein
MKRIGILRWFVITAATARQLALASSRCVAIVIISCVAASISAADTLLGSAVIDGSSAYGFPQLFEIYKSHLGRPLNEQTAAAIGAAAQQQYVDDGYARPGYRIHDRGLQSGIVRIRLIEARIANVELVGGTGPYRHQLQELFSGLTSGASLRPGDITEALRQARRLPGLSVDVSIAPDASQSGTYRLDVKSSYKPIEGSVKLSNRGTEEIGRNLLLAQFIANGLAGHQSSSGLFLTSAEDSDTYSGGGLFHNAAVGNDGATAQLQFAMTSLQIESDSGVVDQDRQRWLAKFVQPFGRNPGRDLSAFGGFEVDNLEVAQDVAVSREDRLRSLNAGLLANWRGAGRSSLLSAEVELGVNVARSNPDDLSPASDTGKNNFSIWRMHYARTARLGDSVTWRVDGYGQYSVDALPSVRQFKVGGGRIGRGFEAAAASGDRGVGVKLDLRRPIDADLPWLGPAQIYGYYDLGAAWRNDLPGRESAASTGVGLAASGELFAGYLEVAKPLTHPDADGNKDIGIFAELTYRF